MSRIHFRFISILGPLIGLIVLLAANGHQTQAAASDLFFSEYLEGITSTINNHALEIYNGTGATVNLSGYSLELYPNGVTFPSVTLNLSGTLVSGDVYVIAHPQADTPVLAVADLLDAGINGFDGNDAIALVKSGTGKIDVIGKIGENPGTEWGSGLTSTADNTLVRKPAICAGDSNGSDPFDPSIQWIGFPQDTMTDIGKHTSDCVPANTATSTPTSTLTKTSTFTATPTKSPTPTSTGTVPTSTSTPTSTATFTSTATSTPSSTSGGSTATPTSTATETTTVTPTEPAGVELLLNTSMETDENGNGVPDGWQGKDKTGDKLMCNDEDHIFAHTGLCAFRFKGGPNEQSKLSQKVLLDGLNFAVDDQLNFSVYVNALKSKAKGTIKVRVKYGDLDTKGKITKQFVKTDGYEAVEGTIVIASTDVITIKVVFKHTSPSGKIYIDDGSIRWVSGGGAIALPLAP